MKIRLSNDERLVLLANAETAALTKRVLDDGSIRCEPEQCDELREACAELLQRIGFDEEYRPTKAGILLEQLIDRLFVGNA